VAFSDSSAYAIKIAAAETGVARIMTRPLQPEPLTDDQSRAWKDAWLRLLEEMPDEVLERQGRLLDGRWVQPSANEERRRRRQLIENTRFYPHYSIVQGLSTTWSGKIWVWWIGQDGTNAIDVLDMEGTYVGSYPMEGMGTPQAFGPDGLAAYFLRDELGVQTIVVKRLPLEVN
jgi:hypothetical protein